MLNQKRALLAGLICAGWVIGTARAQDPTFELGVGLESTEVADLEATSLIEGEAGTTVDFVGHMTLTGSGITGDEGAQGWSISVMNEGVDILEVTVDGSAAAPVTADPPGLANGGFGQTEKVDPAKNGGKQGFVSATVLSFTMPITLPPNETSIIANATYRATIPAGEATARIVYENGLQGLGQPVDNLVTFKGSSIVPTLGTREVTLREVVAPVEICDQAGDEDGDGLADCADPDCEGNPICPANGFDLVADAAGAVDGVLEVSPPGAGTELIVTVSIAPHDPASPPGEGAQGWSLGLEHDPAVLDVVADGEFPTTSGTVAAPAPDGLQSGGFEKTEVIDPANNGGRAGVVTAVVLSFTQPITLDAGQSQSILRSKYAVGAGAGAAYDTLVEFADGLKGAGQPVDTVLTVAGETQSAIAKKALRVVNGPEVVEVVLRRGDPNDDGKVNIADPIWIINELVRSGPATACQDAADANDDGMVDLSDAMFLIEYRFLGGEVPKSPFPDCGVDPTEDALDCAPGSYTHCE